ncbi:LysR substrate-binding domain-containing protein [Pseudomonas sp. NA-150]|uniref:LysR substrate-binding domain-containing protein n=1 Tax=Pseudomonas sp. NA-150 TaxID=3367525 RepID=UPI0037CC3DA8
MNVPIVLHPECADLNFNPATSRVTFGISLSEDIEFGLLNKLVHSVQGTAPHMVLLLHQYNWATLPDRLNTGEISLVVGYDLPTHAHLRQHDLRSFDFHVLRADCVPGPIGIRAFCMRSHIVTPGSEQVSRHIDCELMKLGHTRHIALAVPNYSCLRSVLAGTDRIAIVPKHVADILVSQGGVRSEPLPISPYTTTLTLTWPVSLDRARANQWFRSRIGVLVDGTCDQ